MSAVPAAASPRDPPALTPPQLKSQLWADAARHVVAVVMGRRVPDLPARLAAAEVIDYDCLTPGALSPAEQTRAPYMVQLERESPFTDWLLFDVAGGLGDWGVLALTAVPALTLRSHLRELAQAELPDGQVIDLDWMDPPILQVLLALAGPEQLGALFGPVQAFVVPQADRWSFSRLVAGQLQSQAVRLQPDA